MPRAELDRVADCANRARSLRAELDDVRESLRLAVLAAHMAGDSFQDIAEAAGVSQSRAHQIARQKPRSRQAPEPRKT
jgi:DNA-directed RNA polymerase specialized sigma24 family protein